MTYQTETPLQNRGLSPSARSAGDLIHFLHGGETTLEAPYQRGPVWSTEQRMLLIRSLLEGTPIPALIINRRVNAPVDEPFYAVVDGKQRMLTLSAWFKGELAVPASWFKADLVEATEDTGDGPYVRMTGLTKTGQRRFKNLAVVPVAEAQVATVQEEAEIYLMVNGLGTPQTDDDMDNARTVAGQ